MRLFSIIQWHHFAYMMISIALLGYGASGTFLALARKRLAARAPARLRRLRGAVRRHGGRVLRARRAAAVQRARADLGPPPAALSGRPVRDPVRAVLLRRHVRRARARLLRRAGRPALSRRSARRRQRRARHPRRSCSWSCRAGRSSWSARSACSPRRCQPAATRGASGCGRWPACSAPRPRHPRTAARLDRLAAVAVQGAEPGVARAGRRRRGRALQPARPAECGAQPEDPVSPCAGAEPQQPDRARRPDRGVHRRRGR